MIDGFGRRINYLRLSITDRCNLRCIYCSMCRDFTFVPHSQILTYEECTRLISLSPELGLEKIRLTGGEPFIRRGFLEFVVSLLEKFPFLDIRITTNGTLVKKSDIMLLKDAGIRSINVSLDTFDRNRFQWITGKDLLGKVLETIDCLLEIGVRTKINVVSLKGINDKELHKFVHFAFTHPLDVRFIEFMDLSGKSRWHKHLFLSAQEILEQIGKEVVLLPVKEDSPTRGPARMYKIKGGEGRIGIISPLSNHFCSTCNRVRITPDGRVKTCLFSPLSYRIKPILRNKKFSQRHLIKVLKRLIEKKKPSGYKDVASSLQRGEMGMYSIGG